MKKDFELEEDEDGTLIFVGKKEQEEQTIKGPQDYVVLTHILPNQPLIAI